MSRAVTIGNGSMLVGMDARGQVRDLYFPFVGEANHVSGASGNYVHRIGVFVDGTMSWLDDDGWNVTCGCDTDSPIGSLFAEHKKLGVTLTSHDAVHNEENVLLRHFILTNQRAEQRVIKLMLAQQFRIFESRRGDTGYYDPRVGAIVHYKGNTAILVNAISNGKQFSEYNIGLFGIEGREGTYLDAEDGILSCNPIEHGSVDSVIALENELAGGASVDAYYWIVCAASIPEAHQLDAHVLKETPEVLINSTAAYWRAWLEKSTVNVSNLSPRLQSLFKRSLLIMRAHADNNGGIIASSDTSMLHHGRDTYSYVWPRDGALIAHAFDETGYGSVAKRFYEFIDRVADPAGYVMHKYRADGVLGSSWHPWIIDGEAHLPIQEDETATVLCMLWRHYESSKDIEFVESLYNSFIEPAAEFMCEYIENTTGLPQASFDLWEEKYGSSTYTAASVYGGLMAAARFAMLLGKESAARNFQAVAQRIQSAIGKLLFDEESGVFVKSVKHGGELAYDKTLDVSSLHGLLLFEVFEKDDERIQVMAAAVEERLKVHGVSEGFMRYEGDNYYRLQDGASPNPWVICTLWVARYHIEVAKNSNDLSYPLQLLEWTASHASGSGALSEQMQPHTREHLSASPLVWSHAEFVLTVKAYVEKVDELEN